MSPGPAQATYRRTIVPPYLTGDFDGDGRTDHAVLLERGTMQGILLCWGRTAAPNRIGAGVPFNEMKDLDCGAWRVHRQGRVVAPNSAGDRPPTLQGDALVLEWESASALIYWQRGIARWYQQGD